MVVLLLLLVVVVGNRGGIGGGIAAVAASSCYCYCQYIQFGQRFNFYLSVVNDRDLL